MITDTLADNVKRNMLDEIITCITYSTDRDGSVKDRKDVEKDILRTINEAFE